MGRTRVSLLCSGILFFLITMMIVSCGGGGSSTPTPSVSISPGTATLNGGSTQQFTATVSNASNTTVTWSVSCTAGGAACGTISSTGLYTAPAVVASSTSVTVTATLTADTTKSASATITLTPISVSVSPATVSLTGGATQQFSATVNATSNTAVSWSVSCTAGGAACGSISASGLYTAPAVVVASTTVTVQATSSADNTKSATASVTLNPISVTVSPTTASLTAGGTQTFTATVNNTSNKTVTWTATCAGGAACGSIDANGNYTAPAVVVNTTVVTITAISTVDTSKTASATVTLNPLSVAVSPGTTTLTASETQQFTQTVTGNPNTAVTWSVSCTAGGAACGTIDTAGLYTAPAVVTTTSTVTVMATSVVDSTKSGTAVVTLNPLTISVSPQSATLGGAQTQQFNASIAGNPNTAVTWDVSCTAGGAACGTIDTTGLYTAPATVTNQSTVTVTATSVADTSKTATATVTLVPVSVAVTPATVSLSVSGTQQFSASVLGTSNTAVTWSVSCTAGGAACGVIDNTGLYTAPASVSGPLTVTVTATSQADVTKTGTATVTVTSVPVISVTISPSTSQTVTLNGTVYLSATVTNDSSNQGVTWSISPTSGCGNLSNQTNTSATFTAPSSLSSNCSATVTATSVADNTKQASVSISVLQTTSLTINTTQSDITNAGVNLPYGMWFNITGGTAPYHITVSSGSLPSGLAFSSTNQGLLAGNPTASGTYNFTMQVTDSAVSPATISQSYTLVVSDAPTGAHNSYLTGQYACVLNGFIDADGSRWAMLTSVTADGSGNVTSGIFDYNSKASGFVSGALTGTYSLGSDNRGVMSVTTSSGTFTYVLAANNVSAAPATTVHLIEFDDAGNAPTGQHGGGVCYKQDPTKFVSSTLSGGFAFGMSGESGLGVPKATIGRLSMSNGTISAGEVDQAKGATVNNAVAFTGNYGVPDSNGRFTMALITAGGTNNFVSYIIDADHAILMSSDSHATAELQSGDVRRQQQSTYSAANMNGAFVLYEQIITVNTSNVIQGYMSQIMQGVCSTGACNVNISDTNDGGTYRHNDAVGAGTATVESSGRVTITPSGGGSGLYLYLYDQNSGFVLDPGSTTYPTVGYGSMEQQTQTLFTTAALAGTYILDSLPEMQSDSGDSTGYVTSDSSGNITGVNDSAGQFWTDYNLPIVATWTFTDTTYGQATVSLGGSPALYCYAITANEMVCVQGNSSHPDIQRLVK